jgi:hypothetical protein
LEFNVNGKIYCLVNNAHIVYQGTAFPNQGESLIKRVADGGIVGDDVCITSKKLQYVDIEGIDKHQLPKIQLLLLVVLCIPIMVLLLLSYTNTHSMLVVVGPLIPLDNSSGIIMKAMTYQLRSLVVYSI